MPCSRCHGLMIVDAFIDMDDDSGQLWLGAARCVNCGEVADLGIARNRQARSRTLHPVRLTASPQATNS